MSWSGPNSTDRKIYLSEMRSVSKHMVVGRGKELGPVLKQNTSDKKSTPATYIGIVALKYIRGN